MRSDFLLKTQEPEKTVLSVTMLNQQIRRLLEISFPNIWVEGEISNLVLHASGHWYFSLKDDSSHVRSAMFKGQNRLCRIKPVHGMQVLLKASASLYAGRGEFQLIVQYMEKAGEGALQRAFEQLKHKLSQEGLFNEERKQPLPAFPKQIGVISSPTGAVIHDICSVLKRRFPMTEITLFPTLVQGKEAAKQIVQNLKLADTKFNFDALILARGGGSLEDLQPFNEEKVARAIACCSIPVVSSVGHETDFTIADFVADYRAPTPSVAAEVLSPDQHELAAQLKQYAARLHQLIIAQLQKLQAQVAHLYTSLKHPDDYLREHSQHLDHLTTKLHHAAVLQYNKLYHQTKHLLACLHQHHPKEKLTQARIESNHLKKRLILSASNNLALKKEKLHFLCGKLDAFSPLCTLGRGYSITEKADGTIIYDYKSVKPAEMINIRLYKGKLQCTVNTVDKEH